MNKIEFIKASAGSGKTFYLMNRLSESIANGTRPEKLLATTFTVKAAAELQSRIRQKLLECSRPELASQVFDGLIGTVNGVCGRLLSEYAIEAGLSPSLDVLPEENADVIFSAATCSAIDKYTGELENVASRLSMNPIKDKIFGRNLDWKNDVREILNLARSNGLDKEMLCSCGKHASDTLRKIFTATENLSLDDIKKKISDLENYNAEGKATKDTVRKIKNFVRFPTWAKAAQLAKTKYAVSRDPDFPINIFREIDDKLLSSRELYEDMATMISGVFACAGESLEAYAQYKKNFGLVDFVDQECNVLSLLENNPNFVKLMKARLSQIMVDEFQDTSPVQLALFLKLNECSANGSIWVGDPKQAIYGFRGTDPELMNAVLKSKETAPTCNPLTYSWRSKENLVNLSNEIFTKTFESTMSAEDVRLDIPEERKEKAIGGIIEAWCINGDNRGDRMKSLASGIAELIRDKGITPKDICVFFRNNSECADLAEALSEWNISASAPSGSLLDTAECQLVISAFRYCIDPSDTVALATLLALYGETSDLLNKLHRAKAAWLALSDEERKKTDFLAEIRNIDFLKNIHKKADATPMEILEHVITALNLDGKISAMLSPERRMGNVDELRRRCTEYMQQSLVDRSTATPYGFVASLNSASAKQAAGTGVNTVNVMTYHKSKGLEWPIVILGSLDASGKNGAFGVRVNQAKSFDVKHPLLNRTIHYWPWPFGDSKKLNKLDSALSNNQIHLNAKKLELEEGKRLFYVGFTRAKDQVIFAMNCKHANVRQTNWLDSLSNDLLNFPTNKGSGSLAVGTKTFQIETKFFYPPENIVPLPSADAFADKPRDISETKIVPARLSPSEEICNDGKATLLRRWGYKSSFHCEPGKYDLLGNAFHIFAALNTKNEEYREIAERILKNWTVDKIVTPEALMECTNNLYRWIDEVYPKAKISCEVPITYRNENGTLYQGFIDMLLEMSEGYVIIDHKTHPIASDAEEYAANCAGQLRLYRKAVEAATGKIVKQTIIHFPNLGMCFEVK